jgi:hypothetical protein
MTRHPFKIERRPIAPKSQREPRKAPRSHAEPITPPLGPIAAEVADALRNSPIAFPRIWFRPTERT